MNSAKLVGGAYLLLVGLFGTFASESLPRLNIDKAQISVSGISSGAVMATQFHFAHSSEIMGAGLFAGGPYLCGYGSGVAGSVACMTNPGFINIAYQIAKAQFFAGAGDIDPMSNIEGDNVYIFHGTKDSTVKQLSGKKTKDMYSHFGANIKAEFSVAAEHGQPMMDAGGPCDSVNIAHHFLNNCSYDGAYEALNHIYGGDLIRPTPDTVAAGDLVVFDQEEFFNYDALLVGMADNGLVYIPSACRDGATQCRLHVAFHGCLAYRALIGDSYATDTGYLEVAELNNIVIIFPQVFPIATNPNGCWDWYDYLLDVLYPTKYGKQISGVYRMINRVSNP